MDALNQRLEDFIKDESSDELIITNNDISISTKKQRHVVHEACEHLGLFSKTFENTIKVTKELQNPRLTVNDEDRKSFIKHFSLPITVWFLPYFLYFMELYDPWHSTKEKYEWFITALTFVHLNGKISIDKYAFEIANQIGNDIMNTEGFKNFLADIKYKVKDFPNSFNIYSGSCKNKVYISVDIITANFSAINFFDPTILNASCWRELITKYTNLEYFINSKQYRQIVFGKLKGAMDNISTINKKPLNSPMKKISNVQRFLVNELYKQLFPVMKILGASTDEIIIDSTMETCVDDVELIKSKILLLPETMHNIFKIVPFSLTSLDNRDGYIKKNLFTNKLEIKGLNKDFYAQVFKTVTNQKICPYDMKSIYNDMVITYDEQYLEKPQQKSNPNYYLIIVLCVSIFAYYFFNLFY